MKLYHGTDIYFKSFDTRYSGTYKDFGSGIYLATSYQHAINVAIWKNGLHGYVYTYDLDYSYIKNHFKSLEFRSCSVPFLKFIVENRTGKIKSNIDIKDIDFVVGPTADARAQSIIQNFIKSHSSPTDKDYNDLRVALNFGRYPAQYCIKSYSMLNYINSRRVKEEQVI